MGDQFNQGRIDKERACNSHITCIDNHEMLTVTIDSAISRPEWPYYGFVICQFALAQWGKDSNC